MIVLHALWDWEDGARLHIWAESSRQPAKTKRGGRRASSARSRAHPFALDTESLREALGELAGSLLAREAQTGLITLRLPATASGPLASPELVREEMDATGASGFARWEVPVLTLAARAALDALLALPVTPPPDRAFGSSLRFWVTAARLASELVARQAYMPALQQTGQKDTISLRAAWEALLDADDEARVSEL
ncbi:MAG TPA: hypothetical protein VHD63_12690, partial [Ktedonobacteraceae bacterium]|nr:hypothetical protein [Ktedonobacteraceae bacterium]